MKTFAVVAMIICILAAIGLMNLGTLVDDANVHNLPTVEFSGEDKVELDLIAAYYEHCDDRYHPTVCGIWAYHKAQEMLR